MIGGGGYIGTELVAELLNQGCSVSVLDLFWFGDYLPDSQGLKILKKDARDLCIQDLEGVDVVFHFAGVANDPSSSLNPALCWDIAVTSVYKLAEAAIRLQAPPRIIFASSGSVYGVQSIDRVTEDLELYPMTTYNKSKIAAERTLLSYSDALSIQIIRPATVCGVSPRMSWISRSIYSQLLQSPMALLLSSEESNIVQISILMTWSGYIFTCSVIPR